MFINIGDIPMTEEEMLAKISKCSSFHGGILNQSQDNRSVWIVRTEFSDEFKNHYTLKSASNLNGNLNCSKELEHYAS